MTPFRRWVATVEPLAYGDLGLKPWEFWRLTPHEFRLLAAGHRWREEDRWYRLAALGAWLLAPHLKAGQSVTPETLLDWPRNWRVSRARERRALTGTPDGDDGVQPARLGRRARPRER